MESKEEKAKKLKEIQDRLAEIQSKSAKKPEPKVEQSKPTPVKMDEPLTSPPLKPDVKESPGQETSTPETIKPTEQPLEQPWAGNKPKKEVENKSQKTAPIKPKTKSSTKSKVIPVLSFAITLLVVGYFGYTYFGLDNEEVDVVTADIPEEPKTEPVTTTVASVAETRSEDEPNSSETTIPEAPEKKPEVPKEKAVPKASPSKAVVPKGFIISYASNSTREIAEGNVASLKEKGFKANYYYMPDQQKNNPQLYKVYIGPYASESAAFPDFKKVIKINDKAFIFKMN